MLSRVDRIQAVVADRHAAAVVYRQLLGAEVVREDRLRPLAARRTVVHLGSSEVELLEPDGAGPVADFLRDSKGGLFAAGFASPELGRLRGHLRTLRIAFAEDAGQILISADALQIPGLRTVISAERDASPPGLVSRLYEVTLLVQDAASAAARAAVVFGLDPAAFVPIHSAQFGYQGTLTLFHRGDLDRVEIVTPTDANKTMGRFFSRRGASLYMCYCEADDLGLIRDRLRAHVPNDWTGAQDEAPPDNLFIHPRALAGMMLGVSRTTFAWTWSGHPERVRGR